MFPMALRHREKLGAEFAVNAGFKSFSSSERLSSTLRKSSGEVVS